MKTFFNHGIKGLIYFIFIYALARICLTHPLAVIQGKDFFSIFLGIIIFLWIIFPKIINEVNLPLTISFLSLSVYSLFTWTKFDKNIFKPEWFQDLNDEKISLLIVLFLFFLSLIIFVSDLFHFRKELNGKKMTFLFLTVPLFFFLMTALIFAGDYFLPTLISW